ncbi:MAG: SDR family oxidoreductase [Novosphingobium sp.]|nr:SDR family oxidoreductase [Novosphingobium sp.]
MKIAEFRHAFITGGASGFGLALAEAIHEQGVAVTIADANEEAVAAATAGKGARFRGCVLDVRDRDGWARARAEAEAAFGPVDLLFANAGIAPDGKHLSDMPPESFDRVIAINLTGVFNAISEFGASIREQGRGHIAMTSSMSGMVMDGPGIGSYGPSKAGVIAMGEALRMEMEPHGVGVSVFCPGTTATNLMENTKRLGGALMRDDASLRGMPITPASLAPVILRGIEENRRYIFTHPERRTAVEERYARIIADFETG